MAGEDTGAGGDVGSVEPSASGETAAPAATGSSHQGNGKAPGASQAPATDKDGKDAKDASPRYKTRRGGKDVEHSGDELAKMMRDDYEHEFKGPGGAPVKHNWQQITRAVQQSQGIAQRLAEIERREQELAAQVEWGGKNVPEFLETKLGVKNHREWAMEVAREEYKLRQLNDPQSPNYDPERYHQEISRQAQEQHARTQKLEKFNQERQQSEQQKRQQAETREQGIRNVAQAAGVPVNELTRSIAIRIADEAMAARIPLDMEDFINQVRAEYHEHTYKFLDGMDAPKFAEWFGEDRRKRLREYELEAAKAAKKSQKEDPPKPTATTHEPARTQQPVGKTEAQLRREAGPVRLNPGAGRS